MQGKSSFITAGQFFTLLFVGRYALTMIYSSRLSGISSLWSLVLPLLIMIPAGLLLLLPSLASCSAKNSAAQSHTLIGSSFCGKLTASLYGLYFLYQAAVYLVLMLGFVKEMLPEGVSARMIMLLILAGCTYACAKGIEAAARMSLIVLVLMVVSAVLLTVFLGQSYSADRLIPLRAMSVSSVLDGTVFLISRFGGASCINVLSDEIKGFTESRETRQITDVKESFRGHLKRTAVRSGIIWCFVSVLSVLAMIVLFTGSAGAYTDSKEYSMFRVIDSSGVLQRAEPVFILTAVCSVFCGLSLMMISAAKCIRTVFTKLSGTRTALLICVFLLLILFLPSGAERIFIGNAPETSGQALSPTTYFSAFLAVLFTAVIPFIAVLLRRLTHPPVLRTAVKAASVVLALCLLVSSSGCTALQLNQRIIVQGIGIDKHENAFRLTLITLNTEAPAQDNSTGLMFTEGENIGSAVSRLESERGKKLLLDQCLFVMMNEAAADSGGNSFSYLIGSNDMPKNADLLVSSDGAENTVRTAKEKLGYTSEDISLLTASKAVKERTAHCSLLELIQEKNVPSGTVLIPLVEADEKSMNLTAEKGILVFMDGGHILLDGNETKLLILLRRNDSEERFSFSTDSVKRDSAETNGSDTGFVGSESRTKSAVSSYGLSLTVIPELRSDELTLAINAEVSTDNADPEQCGIIKRDAENRIESLISKAVRKNGADALSLSRSIRNAYPGAYSDPKDMKMLFMHCRTRISVRIK